MKTVARSRNPSFDRGNPTAALNQSSAFQSKLRAQVVPSNSALVAAAQQIIAVVSGR